MLNKNLFLILFIILLIGLVSAETFGYGRTEEIPINYSNIVINETSNQSEYWNTDIGSFGTVNSTQHDNSDGTLNIDISWISSLWCALTGCTMSGNIDMDGYNLTNVGNIAGTSPLNVEDGLIVDGNATADVGFFDAIGSSISRVLTGWFVDLDVEGTTTTEVIVVNSNLTDPTGNMGICFNGSSGITLSANLSEAYEEGYCA